MAFGPYDPTANFFKADAVPRIPKTAGFRKIPISKVSKKRLEENKLYESAKRRWRKLRKITDGFRCEVIRDSVRCERVAANNPHHIQGRIGKLLWDVKNFLAACQRCHDYIHANPKFGYDNGYLKLRN